MRTAKQTIAPHWVRTARHQPDPPPQKYYYASEGEQVFRFEYPSDRALWVQQDASGARVALPASREKVRRAKDGVEAGEYQWPKPEWERAS